MIEELKTEVLKKFGSPLIYTKDCKTLADKISVTTQGRISATTVRRLYGFLKSDSLPGKYTLNILAMYAGSSSWQSFCSNQDVTQKSAKQNKLRWSSLYEKSLSLSKETYKLIASQSGINFEAVVDRKQAEERIDSFLRSSKMAMSFVAPGGFGKSSMLAKWFEKNWIKKQGRDAILFLNASFMLSFVNHDFKLDRWIQDQLDFELKGTLMYFLEHPSECEGRIILVIDALDEITYESMKLERLFLQLTQFISNYGDLDRVKLIITSRNSTWEKFALPFVISGNAIKSNWYQMELDVSEEQSQNLYALTDKEIQRVFDRTLNRNFPSKLSVGELAYRQREMISTPFFLELFIKLYNPNKRYEGNGGHQLLHEFLKKKVFYSRYSDEKMDLLYGILKLIKHGKNGTSVKKLELRKLFPIHLKSVGNYFFAYQELVSYGILSEYIASSEYPNYCRCVKITNEHLFETLLGMDLIQQNGGVDLDLMKRVEVEYADFEIKNRLIIFLYTSAFLNGDYHKLKNFFQLNDDTLEDPEVMEAVWNSSYYLNEQKMELMEYYAGIRKAELYLFRSFPELHNLTSRNKVVLELFAYKALSENIRTKLLSVLLLDSIFSFDKEKAKKYYQELNKLDFDACGSGFTISVRVASVLLYRHFIKTESNDVEILKIFYYREMANEHLYREKGKLNGEFELILCMALVYMKSYHKILQLIDDVEYLYRDVDTTKSNLNYRILQFYKMAAQYNLGMKITNSQKVFLKSLENDVKTIRNSLLQVYYNSFVSSVNYYEGDRLRAEKNLNEALELCNQSNYALCASSVLRKMAKYYNIWGDKEKENFCLNKEKEFSSDTIPVFDSETFFA